MASFKELKQYIRFSLAEISAANDHHEFEKLAFQFARQRICSNLILATGPVGGGGDQGRDFESFRTFIKSTPGANSSFLALIDNRKIVGACSAKKDIVKKIRADLKSICSDEVKVDHIYYFAAVPIKVSKIHELQQEAKEKYGVELDVFDQHALADHLATCELFPLANEYLSVSPDLFPSLESGSPQYQKYFEKWQDASHLPWSYVDFWEIKLGLRCSTFEEAQRPHINVWISKIEGFLHNENTSPKLQQQARYEIIVAALRGLNQLNSYKDVISDYFSDFEKYSDVSSLESHATLLAYLVAADNFEIQDNILQSWLGQLSILVERSFELNKNSNHQALLLTIQGQIEWNVSFLSYKRTDKSGLPNMSAMLDYWCKAMDIAKDAPLFPLESFAKRVQTVASLIEGDPRFEKVMGVIDSLLYERNGRISVAQNRIGTAITLMKSNKIIAAIKHLHHCKVNWLSSETLKECIMTLLFLAECYSHLRLIFAAKYYAAAAVFMINNAKQEELNRLLPKALFSLASYCYANGEWLTFLQMSEVVLLAHNYFDSDRLDLNNNENLRNHIMQACVSRGIIHRHDSALAEKIEGVINEWAIDPQLREILQDLHDDETSFWNKATWDELWKTSQVSISMQK